jgi:16S rRNA G1207 methylase RsmC
MLQLLHDARRILRSGGGASWLAATARRETGVKMLERLFGNALTIAQAQRASDVVANVAETPASISPTISRRLARSGFVITKCRFRWPATTSRLHAPGVFSWEHLDEATEVLARLDDEAIGPDDSGARHRLRCGRARRSRRSSDARCVCLVDVDSEAVRCASKTLQAAGC